MINTSAPRQQIQSVARAARILIAVAESPHGLTATDVAETLQVPLSTAYHLLATLEDEELVAKEIGKRYLPGAKFVDLTNAPGLRPRVDAAHRRALKNLADATRETTYLTGWFRGEVRILATVEGSQAVRVAGLEVGLAGDVHARASAKVLLAFADNDQREEVLAGVEYTPFSPFTVRDRNALEAQFAQIRREGIFYDQGEYREGVRSLSAPIRRADGRVVAAIALTVPEQRYIRHESTLVDALSAAVALAEVVDPG